MMENAAILSKIAVSIVIYGQSDQEVTRLLNGLSLIPPDQIFVLDNLPGRPAAAWQARCRYLPAPANLGYGGGNNHVHAQLPKGFAYFLVMNPDIEVSTKALAELALFMEQHADVGLLMPDVRYPDGRRQELCKLLPSPLDLFVRRFLPGRALKQRLTRRYELADWSHDHVAEIPFLSGCFMFLRVSAFEQVGGFDHRYFMYMEDVDLVRRIGNEWKTLFYPLVQVVHYYQKGSYHNWRLLRFHTISAIRYFNRWGWLFDATRTQRNRRAIKSLLGGAAR